MAVFQQSDAVSTGSSNKNLIIILIVAVVLVCCCCAAVIAILIATGTITSARIEEITNQNSFLPLYLTLRTCL